MIASSKKEVKPRLSQEKINTYIDTLSASIVQHCFNKVRIKALAADLKIFISSAETASESLQKSSDRIKESQKSKGE